MLENDLTTNSVHILSNYHIRQMTFKEAFELLASKATVSKKDPFIVINSPNVNVNTLKLQTVLNSIYPFHHYTLIVRHKIKDKWCKTTKIKAFIQNSVIVITNYI